MSKNRLATHGRPRKRFRGRRAPSGRTPQDNVRANAAWVLERTEATLSPAAVFLDSALGRCDPCDHGLLRQLTLGSLRWKRRLDHVIALASHRTFEQIEPALWAPLRIGAYQLLFLDRIPAHAAVHEAVEQAGLQTHRGGASFANAVLRRIARQRQLGDWPVEESDPVRRLGIEHSHPDFLVRRWCERFGRERTERLLAANNQPKAMHLLTFADRGGRELLAETLIDYGMQVEPSAMSQMGLIVRHGNPLATDEFAQGVFYIQDEASQAAALIPAPRPGERILDLAAAPGGKSFALIASEPSIELVASDVSVQRIDLLRRNLRRLRRSLRMVVCDAGKAAFGGTFDRVVLDLPCSGTGTLRKNPELKWRLSEAEIDRLARQAGRVLAGAAPRVRVGGLLVVITCSLELEENEQVVERFLARHQDFSLEPLAAALEYPLDRWLDGPGRWRVFPEEQHDGFTVHVLRRGES